MSLKSNTELDDTRPRAFAQARARRTFESLIAAAEQEFSAHGFDDTQTPNIAARAEVSVGTFYRYFEDKKEILLEVLKRDLARGRDEVLSGITAEALAAGSRRETIAKALRILYDNCNRNPGLQKLFVEMSLRDDECAQLRLRYEQDACSQIAKLIESVCTPEEVADPEATAYVILTSVIECACASAGARGISPIGPKRSMAALSELVFRAVFGSDSGQDAGQ